MDSDNFIRKDTIGQLKELLLVLNNYKLNAVRLFMYWIHFQNSSSIGWWDIDGLVAKAIKAKEHDM